MGSAYKDFNKENDVFHDFRCGSVHEYFVKHECTIFMLNISNPVKILGTKGVGPSMFQPDAILTPPIETGLVKAQNGRYNIFDEKYYHDFRTSSEKLTRELETNPKSVIFSFEFRMAFPIRRHIPIKNIFTITSML